MKHLEKKVIEWIKRHRLWMPNDTVILAVSGGVDSMVMLNLIARTQRAHKGILRVVTIDHGLRSESEIECEHVLSSSEMLSIPAEKIQLRLQQGANLQERAREERQAALLNNGADRIATAHHLDDQAETVLYRFLRGSGPIGLSALAPLNAPWCRPLLCLSRKEIDSYAKWLDIQWFEDPSNDISLRGKIRQILPILGQLHGNQTATLARSAQICAYDDAFLSSIINLHWDNIYTNSYLNTIQLQELHPALQLRILYRYFRMNLITIRFETLERILIVLREEQFSKSLQVSATHYILITPHSISVKIYDKKPN